MPFRACRSFFTKKLLHFYSMLWCKIPGKFHLITKNQFHLKKVKNLGWLWLPFQVRCDCYMRIVLLVTIFDWLGVYPMPPEGLTSTNLAWNSMLFQVGGEVTGLIRVIVKIPKLNVSVLCSVWLIYCYLFVFCKARFSDNFKKIIIILLNFNKWETTAIIIVKKEK